MRNMTKMKLLLFTVLTLTINITVFGQEDTVRYNQYGQKVERIILKPEARSGVITLESDDKNFKFWTDVRVNVDAAYYQDGYDNNKSATWNQTENNINLSSGFLIRRARIAFKTSFYQKWGAEIDVDFKHGEVDINDVFVRYSVNDNLDFRIGQFREPMGMQLNTSSRYVTFMERASVCELAPNRHVGIGGAYANKYFMLGAGIFSDIAISPDTKDQRKKRGTGAIDGSLAYTGRGMFYVLNQPGKLLGIGVGGTWRTPELPDVGDPDDSYRITAYDETYVSLKKFYDTDCIPYAQHYAAYNIELATSFGPWKLAGEFYSATLLRGKIYDDVD